MLVNKGVWKNKQTNKKNQTKKPEQTKNQNNKNPNKFKKKQNDRQAKTHQNNNTKDFPSWGLFQTNRTYRHFRGPSSEKETPNQLDLIVNECRQKK